MQIWWRSRKRKRKKKIIRKEREDRRGHVEEKEGKENEWWKIKRVKEYKNKKKKIVGQLGYSLQALLKWRYGLKWK